MCIQREDGKSVKKEEDKTMKKEEEIGFRPQPVEASLGKMHAAGDGPAVDEVRTPAAVSKPSSFFQNRNVSEI